METEGSDNSTDVPLRAGYFRLSPFVENIGMRALLFQGMREAGVALLEVPV